MHHDHDLLDKDIDHNILCGAYRLHDFAAATWFELVERCVQLVRQDQLSGRLIDVLETLRCERTQGTYIGDSEVSAPSFLGSLRSISPPLHDMLCKVDNFRRISLRDNFDKEKGKTVALCTSFDFTNSNRLLMDKARSSYNIRQLCSCI
jgi:hypothetical protein